MSKDVIVNGTTYNGIESVKLPKVGGGFAEFTEAENVRIATGSFTPQEDMLTVDITGLPFAPKAFALMRANSEPVHGEARSFCCGVLAFMNIAFGFTSGAGGATAYAGSAKFTVQGGSYNPWDYNNLNISESLDTTAKYSFQRTENSVRVTNPSGGTTMVYEAGQEYKWIALTWGD